MPFPVDEKYIIETEQKLGVRFPQSFKNAMMGVNGGYIANVWSVYPFLDASVQRGFQKHATILCMKQSGQKSGIPFPKKVYVLLVMISEICLSSSEKRVKARSSYNPSL